MWLEILLLVLTLFFLWKILKKPSNYPPGPWGLPLIGYLPLGKKNYEEMMMEMNKKYGGVASWRVGTKLIVFVYDYKLLKEAFSGTDIVNRPKMRMLSMFEADPMLGVIASNGIHWHTIRRFALRHLRDLGMGKSRLVSAVQHEAMELVNDLKKVEGKPTTLPKSIVVSVLNVIWQMVASKRYDMNDEKIWKFNDMIEEVMDNGALLTIPDFFPWLRNIIPKPLLTKLTNEKTMLNLGNKMKRFIQEYVEEHQKNLDPNDPRDFIDAYLIEMEKQKDDPSSVMSLEDLTFSISDLFGAGSESTTTTLRWLMLYLAKNPEVQTKLQKEIDQVLPKGILATLEDKPKLPYTDALIHELLRASSLASIGLFHMASRDTMVGGYLVPQGAFVLGILAASHSNPKYFDSPDEFRPERFLDSEGKFSPPKEGLMPFGIGRRQCLGEALARMEIFVFVTTLVQNLSFSPAPGKEMDLKPRPDSPFLRLPNPNQEIVINIR